MVAWRRNSVQRSSLQARRRQPVCAPAGGEAGLGLQPLVEADGITQHLGDGGGGAQLSDQTGGVPCGPAGQLAALDENDVGLVIAGEMISRGTADDATADDDDFGRRRQRRGHARVTR